MDWRFDDNLGIDHALDSVEEFMNENQTRTREELEDEYYVWCCINGMPLPN